MIAVSKRLLGFVFLVLMAAVPLGCLNVNQGPRENPPDRDVSVGGQYGVNVDRSSSGTEVKIGGDRGLVVDHPRD